MSFMKTFAALLLLVVIAAVAMVSPPIIYGQERGPRPPRVLSAFPARAEIGASVRDVTAADKQPSGVIVENVQPGSAADKAGLKTADAIVEFDGEHVRSTR